MDHQRRLLTAYRLTGERTANAASQHKRRHDQKANALPLLPGERVWVRDRNRQGRGKLCPWWDPEPYVILGVVGDAGVVYRVQPEKGGREQTIHRNSLKVCMAPPVEPPLQTNDSVIEIQGLPGPVFYGFPATEQPGPPPAAEPDGLLRRSARTNLGQPPARYRD